MRNKRRLRKTTAKHNRLRPQRPLRATIRASSSAKSGSTAAISISPICSSSRITPQTSPAYKAQFPNSSRKRREPSTSQAKLDNSAPVDIKGKINPLSKQLFLDIVADARDIELSPFSPYSGKYVGYGIEKGKLSFNVKYKLEDRKLSAENKIILNQLTFGEKIESPDAIKLPVLLAVALMKDRNGVIDVDLPIGGSLDDPQFSVGGIIFRIIGNIISKAVTAPFALLGSLFGGGSGQELSYVEFDYGRAALDSAGETKIDSLAKAMNNRPALKVDISGRFDPVNDLEGLKKPQWKTKSKRKN